MHEEPDWVVLPLLDQYLDAYGDQVLLLKQAAYRLPCLQVYPHVIYYQPEKDLLRFSAIAPREVKQAWQQALVKQAGTNSDSESMPPDYLQEPWVLIKRSYSAPARAATDMLGFTAGPANAWYGGPQPLAASLLGGLAGAGLGYLGGAASDYLAGDLLEKGRLRKTLALAGGLLGATPGAVWGYHNMAEKGLPGLLSQHPNGPSPPSPIQPSADRYPDLTPLHDALKKNAEFAAGSDLAAGSIPVDDFGSVIWNVNDPYTPMSLRAATMGLVDAASMSRGGLPIVHASDAARIAIGMGSGYLAAQLVGSTLGALAGLRPEAQEALQRAGTWTGLLQAVIPGAFGGGH